MRIYDTGTPSQRESAITEAEQDHEARVRAHIAAEVRAAGGWIGFDRFMELSLYAPGLGYYSAGARKLGPGGDFTTAPEISRLFGAAVASAGAGVLEEIGGGAILEIGAGSGRLAGDLIEFLGSRGIAPAHYWILDVSAELRERQREYLSERLGDRVERVEWLDGPPAATFDGLIVANEVLDALPVVRFRWRRGAVEELGVECRDGDRFEWSARPARPALAMACEALREAAGGDWADGY